MGLPNKAKKAFDKVVEWDRKCAKKIQDKFNLTDYPLLKDSLLVLFFYD